MAAEQVDLADWLAVRRAQGGVQVWRLDLIEALHARAAAHQGEARRMLEARISALVAECEAVPAHAAVVGTGAAPEPGVLAALADELAARQRQRDEGAGRQVALPALEASRRTWARLRTEAQLRQSLEQMDEDAGPLNSGRLVHRALTLMQQCSPGYLQHFVAYVDALSSLESLRASTTPGMRAAAAKPARSRTRKRP